MTDRMHLQQLERRRDKTPAHKINVQSLTASVGEPQVIDSTPLILVDHEVTINEAYYRNVMLFQQFLLAIRHINISQCNVATRLRCGWTFYKVLLEIYC